jgi:hypothetical protein
MTHQKNFSNFIESENVEAFKNYLHTIENPSIHINALDKDSKQTILYQAVQIKNKDVAYALSESLIKSGVINKLLG